MSQQGLHSKISRVHLETGPWKIWQSSLKAGRLETPGGLMLWFDRRRRRRLILLFKDSQIRGILSQEEDGERV